MIDQHGRLAIAKFPKETDEYSLERWEAIALDLAVRAGIRAADHALQAEVISRLRRKVTGAAPLVPYAATSQSLRTACFWTHPPHHFVIMYYVT